MAQFVQKVRLAAVLGLFTAAAAAQLPFIVINELDSDTPGTDILEFIELYAPGSPNTSLAGYTIVFYNGAATNDASYFAMDLTGSTDGNGFYLMGNVGLIPAPAQIWPSNTLQNGADGVALYFGTTAASFPNNTPVLTVPPGAVLVDALVYGTDDPADAGLLAALTPGFQQTDEGPSSTSPGVSVGRCADATPGPLDPSSFQQMIPSPGTFNLPNCIAPFRISISQTCPGPITLSVTGALPFSQLFNVIALTCSSPAGSGILFGVNADDAAGSPIVTFSLPLGTVPFHVMADASGNYNVVFPTSGACPSPFQFSVEAVSVEVTPALGITNITPLTSGCVILNL